MKRIKYNKYRALLSDTLPFETPIFFSNRTYCRFLDHNQISTFDGKRLTKNSFAPIVTWLNDAIKNCNFTIPYTFKIRHKPDSFRELSLIHPFSQMKIVDFYDDNKAFIISLHSISKYSLRHISSVAKAMYYKDSLHLSKLDTSSDIELEKNEYESLRSFFKYEKYKNINEFYESYEYLNAEKSYNHLLKLDVSKCFDSIYTHSIAWAIQGKTYAKKNISLDSFSKSIDKLMQYANYKETHGIPIGPEFSRIFAEIIFQRIDNNLEGELEKCGFTNKCKIYRYVDDFFLFYNDESVIKYVVDLLRRILHEYKLNLNDEKAKQYDRPIISEKTIADRRIRKLLVFLEFDINKNERRKRYVPSIITEFKCIIAETGVEYKDILNYTMSIIYGYTIRTLKNIEEQDSKRIEYDAKNYILDLIDFSSFLYAMNPRVNLTLDYSKILDAIILFSRKTTIFDSFTKDAIRKYIYDRINDVLKQSKVNATTPLETLYLFPILSELGDEYLLDEKTLQKQFFNDDVGKKGIGYFELITALFYIKNYRKYSAIKKRLLSFLDKYLESKTFDSLNECETFLLLMDILACPYIKFKKKCEFGKKFNLSSEMVKHLYDTQCLCFTEWKKFKLSKALDLKKGVEVY